MLHRLPPTAAAAAAAAAGVLPLAQCSLHILMLKRRCTSAAMAAMVALVVPVCGCEGRAHGGRATLYPDVRNVAVSYQMAACAQGFDARRHSGTSEARAPPGNSCSQRQQSRTCRQQPAQARRRQGHGLGEAAVPAKRTHSRTRCLADSRTPARRGSSAAPALWASDYLTYLCRGLGRQSAHLPHIHCLTPSFISDSLLTSVHSPAPTPAAQQNYRVTAAPPPLNSAPWSHLDMRRRAPGVMCPSSGIGSSYSSVSLASFS